MDAEPTYAGKTEVTVCGLCGQPWNPTHANEGPEHYPVAEMGRRVRPARQVVLNLVRVSYDDFMQALCEDPSLLDLIRTAVVDGPVVEDYLNEDQIEDYRAELQSEAREAEWEDDT